MEPLQPEAPQPLEIFPAPPEPSDGLVTLDAMNLSQLAVGTLLEATLVPEVARSLLCFLPSLFLLGSEFISLLGENLCSSFSQVPPVDGADIPMAELDEESGEPNSGPATPRMEQQPPSPSPQKPPASAPVAAASTPAGKPKKRGRAKSADAQATPKAKKPKLSKSPVALPPPAPLLPPLPGNGLILGAYQPGQLLVGEQWQEYVDKILCTACRGGENDDQIILCDGALSLPSSSSPVSLPHASQAAMPPTTCTASRLPSSPSPRTTGSAPSARNTSPRYLSLSLPRHLAA